MPDLALRGVPDDVHRALRAAARRNHRSLNGEILARLEASVRDRPVDVAALLERIDARAARSRLSELSESAIRALKEEGRA